MVREARHFLRSRTVYEGVHSESGSQCADSRFAWTALCMEGAWAAFCVPVWQAMTIPL